MCVNKMSGHVDYDESVDQPGLGLDNVNIDG